MTLPEYIQDYEILGELSRGGMGSVLLARRRREGGFERLFAVKIIRSDIQGDQKARARFLDEARLIAQLDHASIAQVYDFGERDGMLFMVMEYIRGIPLTRLFRAALTPRARGTSELFTHRNPKGTWALLNRRDRRVHEGLKKGKILTT